MAWVAVDRFVRVIDEFGDGGDEGAPDAAAPAPRCAERIHAEVCERGLQPQRRARSRSRTAARALDASVLVIPHVGFLPGSDPRVKGTVAAVEKRLLRDGFVLRYATEHGADGLPGTEGAFLACSFWLADNYAFAGRLEEAEALFERLLSLRNHLGLLSEEWEPKLQAPDRQLPAGVLAPRADHDRADHRGGVAEPVLDPARGGGQRPRELIVRSANLLSRGSGHLITSHLALRPSHGAVRGLAIAVTRTRPWRQTPQARWVDECIRPAFEGLRFGALRLGRCLRRVAGRAGSARARAAAPAEAAARREPPGRRATPERRATRAVAQAAARAPAARRARRASPARGGDAGTSGTSGAAGTSGVAGTAGTAGAAGTSGAGGAAGSAAGSGASDGRVSKSIL